MDNLPPDELKTIAIDMRAGQIFCDRNCPNPQDIGMVFLPLILMDDKMAESIKKDPPGLIYEYVKNAGPRSINGMPIFSSCRFLSQDDTLKVFRLITKLKQAELSVDL